MIFQDYIIVILKVPSNHCLLCCINLFQNKKEFRLSSEFIPVFYVLKELPKLKIGCSKRLKKVNSLRHPLSSRFD